MNPAPLTTLIMGFRTTQLVYVAAKLGLADDLADGPKTVSELASLSGAHPRSLYRLMRALASLGIFREGENGYFELTPPAEKLRRGTDGSLHGLATLYGEEWLWRAYGRMIDSVRTGETAFPRVHGGASLYEYLEKHKDAATTFHTAMSGFSGIETAAILQAYDFTAGSVIVDVGGGHGALLAALLNAHPHLNGIVFDLDTAAEGARRTLTEAALVDRARFVSGDFFQSVPKGGDYYVIKSVIHNWSDEAAAAILRNSRAAMAEGARLLVIERVIPPGNEPSEAKLFDINMLVSAGGQERTQREYETLLAQAGFRLTGVIPTRAPVSVIEAMPATG